MQHQVIARLHGRSVLCAGTRTSSCRRHNPRARETPQRHCTRCRGDASRRAQPQRAGAASPACAAGAVAGAAPPALTTATSTHCHLTAGAASSLVLRLRGMGCPPWCRRRAAGAAGAADGARRRRRPAGDPGASGNSHAHDVVLPGIGGAECKGRVLRRLGADLGAAKQRDGHRLGDGRIGAVGARPACAAAATPCSVVLRYVQWPVGSMCGRASGKAPRGGGSCSGDGAVATSAVAMARAHQATGDAAGAHQQSAPFAGCRACVPMPHIPPCSATCADRVLGCKAPTGRVAASCRLAAAAHLAAPRATSLLPARRC